MEGSVRRSPRFVSEKKAEGDQKAKLRHRKKRLKVTEDEPEVEVTGDVESSAVGASCDVATAPPADDAAEDALEDVKKRHGQPPSIRCSPSMFKNILSVLNDDMRTHLHAKGFGGLLQFAPAKLDRHLACWLMQRLNPDTMKLELGGGKEISVDELAVWCVFQLPRTGGDPPILSADVLRAKQDDLGRLVCGSSYDPKKGFSVADIRKGLHSGSLSDSLGLRAFFLAAFNSLLFSNSDSYIRLEDVQLSEDVDNIGDKNWCKAVIDDLSAAARVYRQNFKTKGVKAPIAGKSEADKFLSELDEGTRKADTFMLKAAEYSTMAHEVMEQSHNEYFMKMQKLFADSRAERDAANDQLVRSLVFMYDRVEKLKEEKEVCLLFLLVVMNNTLDHMYKGMRLEQDCLGFLLVAMSSVLEKEEERHFLELIKQMIMNMMPHLSLNHLMYGHLVTVCHPVIAMLTWLRKKYQVFEEMRYPFVHPSIEKGPRAGESEFDVDVASYLNSEECGTTTNDPIGSAGGQQGVFSSVNTDQPAEQVDEQERRKEAESASGMMPEASVSTVECTTPQAGKEPIAVVNKSALDGHQEVTEAEANVATTHAITGPSEKQLLPLQPEVYNVAEGASTLDASLSKDEHTTSLACSKTTADKFQGRLRKKPIKYISPFQIKESRPKVPFERALALRHKVANDNNLKGMILLDLSIFSSYTGNDLLSTFGDDLAGDSSILDIATLCLRFDDVLHKQDSVGYRVFVPPKFFGMKDITELYKKHTTVEVSNVNRSELVKDVMVDLMGYFYQRALEEKCLDKKDAVNVLDVVVGGEDLHELSSSAMAANLEMNVASSDEMNVASAVPEVGGGGLAKSTAVTERLNGSSDDDDNDLSQIEIKRMRLSDMVATSVIANATTGGEHKHVGEKKSACRASGAGSAAMEISFDKVQLSTPECQYHAEDADGDTNSADGKDAAIDGSSLEKTQCASVGQLRKGQYIDVRVASFNSPPTVGSDGIKTKQTPNANEDIAPQPQDQDVHVATQTEDPTADSSSEPLPTDIVSIRVKYVKHLVFTSDNEMEDAKALLADHETMVKRKWDPFKRAGWPYV
nr:unnamed protein product [Digitaria exilis]